MTVKLWLRVVMNPASHLKLMTTVHNINGHRVDLADYTAERLSDGTMTWVHRDLSHRIVLVRRQDNQRMKSIRRRAAGKPSYRQRQASAKAAARKRAERVAV